MFLTPFQAARLAQETGMMLAEAQMVIAMRMFGMAGLVPMSPREPTRMVQEKAEAMVQASKAASRAMMSGGGAASVAMAALKPVRRRTRANVKRLTKPAS